LADSFLKIAQDAALATEGVSGILFPGVLPIPKDKGIDIDIHLSVYYGVSIPEVAWNVQENVKKALDEVKGLNIGRINIHIDSIRFRDKEYR
jgi:uncharacterized alkaline shock family protein YloU